MDQQTREEISHRLKRFGISDKEAETYLAVVERGEATLSDLASVTDVSTRYLYDVCESLADWGLVEVDDTQRPTVVRALPPETTFSELTSELSDIQSRVAKHYRRPGPETQEFKVVKAQVTVVKRIRSAIEAAEEEITLSIPSSMLEDLADVLRDAVDRGVLTLLLLSQDPMTADFDRLDGVANAVRGAGNWSPVLLAVDRRRVVVTTPEHVLGRDTDQQAITFTQDQIAPIVVGSFLGNYWPMAEEYYTSDPGDLPATYGGFRRAVFDATLHMRAGRDIEGTFEAAPVEDGSPTREPQPLTGRIVDTRQGIVEPRNSSFGVENAFVVETAEGRVSVGGPGAFLEDYEAYSVELRLA